MEFFDKKEDVIEVQLTQYGKLLLAKGKFRPMYYAFYDDAVMYESQRGGFLGIRYTICLFIPVTRHQLWSWCQITLFSLLVLR
jgi:hypothetical protein